jgi:hypothetical protein
VAGRALDRGIAEKILAAYVDGMRGLDLEALKRVYPSPPDSFTRRIKALKDDYRQCDVRFDQGFQIEPMSGQNEATVVRASGIESCKRKTKQANVDLPTRYQFKLIKDVTGNWVIGELLTQ